MKEKISSILIGHMIGLLVIVVVLFAIYFSLNYKVVGLSPVAKAQVVGDTVQIRKIVPENGRTSIVSTSTLYPDKYYIIVDRTELLRALNKVKLTTAINDYTNNSLEKIVDSAAECELFILDNNENMDIYVIKNGCVIMSYNHKTQKSKEYFCK